MTRKTTGQSDELVVIAKTFDLARAYRLGPYRAFHIRDPKPRLISATAYRDRVDHHALCRVIVDSRNLCLYSRAKSGGKGLLCG